MQIRFEPTPVDAAARLLRQAAAGWGGLPGGGRAAGKCRRAGNDRLASGKWADDNQLWWTGAKPGDKLDMRLQVEQDGTYDVEACMTKAVDYGIVQLWIDDQKAGSPIDLYHDGVVPTGPLAIGSHADGG